jgi:uncharacterized repeat protein (TIGR03803 family)
MRTRFVLILPLSIILAGLQFSAAQDIQHAIQLDAGKPPTSVNVVYAFPNDGITHSDYSHGAGPEDELIQGADGDFYGTTTYGGSGLCTNGSVVIGCGTIFKLTPGGTQKVLFNFTYDSITNSSVNGIWPTAGLVQGRDGNFYGTASAGGNNQAVCNTTDGCGTVFKITPNGAFTLLHQFCSNQCTNGLIEGGQPRGRLIQASDGAFYGVTNQGGNFSGGTVYRISGTNFSTVYYFNGNLNGAIDGANPVGGLIEGKDGYLYGTTAFAGTSPDGGTIFKMTKSGVEAFVYSFPENPDLTYPDGNEPSSALVQATDGNFYGTTTLGGSTPTSEGTLFRITPNGTFTKLYQFDAASSFGGIEPEAGVIQASDGNLYGTTWFGFGTIYQYTLKGAVSPLLAFDCATFGAAPLGVLLQAADGTLYTTSSQCGPGADDGGTVVQVVSGLRAPKPTITRFAPASGKVGASVVISGSHFVGTRAVTFNGRSASFRVVSTSSLKVIVPAGATTGPLKVTNAGGPATSAKSFSVLP